MRAHALEPRLIYPDAGAGDGGVGVEVCVRLNNHTYTYMNKATYAHVVTPSPPQSAAKTYHV